MLSEAVPTKCKIPKSTADSFATERLLETPDPAGDAETFVDIHAEGTEAKTDKVEKWVNGMKI